MMKQSTALKASVLALAATLALAGCNKAPETADNADNAQLAYALPELPATLPLDSGATDTVVFAPDASALPDAAPLRVAQVADPAQAYGFADAAYEYTDALGDAPPDYGFEYDGVEPWAWQGYDNSLAFAEPLDDGYRTYYYRPGEEEPYFIRDPYYSYGFANGLLAVIYAADGGIVSYGDYGPRLSYASRYFARGRNLYTASRRGKRLRIYASNWTAQRPIILASRDRWGAGRAHQPAWTAYHNANLGRQRNYWREETVRRQADSRRFGEWRQAGFKTSPPPRAIPAAWANAKWARDETRFRPAAGAKQAREESSAALRDRRDDANGNRPNRDRDRVAERRQDRQQADRVEARQDRVEQRQGNTDGQQADRRREQAQRQQQREQAQRQQERQQADRQQQREQAQRQQGRQQAQWEREREQADRPQQRQQADRQQRQLRENRQDRPAERPQRQQAQQGERAQAQRERQQSQQAERQQAQAAERAQAQAQAQRQQAQAAERAQAQAQRQQAQQAQRQQAQQAQQQQAAQARQQVQGQAQAERQQAREQRKQDRPNRRDRDQ